VLGSCTDIMNNLVVNYFWQNLQSFNSYSVRFILIVLLATVHENVVGC
jgi:hypothetical protein